MRNFFSHHIANYKTLAILLLLVFDVLISLVFGLSRSIEIPTFHLDGAYQTASGLFRLEAGQLPGRDFIPYLGLGLTLFIFPVFLAFGGDLAASGAATHMLVALSYTFSVALISALLVKSRRILFGAIVGSIFLGMSLWESHNFFIFLTDRFVPGNSLRPLRSFVAYIAVAVIFLVLKSRMNIKNVFYSVAGLAGIFFYWSNDFGTVTSLFLILFTISLVFYHKSASAGILFKTLFIYFLSLTLTAVLLTGFHPRELIEYNFIDVRLDQWWYFGPWSEESRIFGFKDFLPKILIDFGFFGNLGFWWMIGPVGLLLSVIWQPQLERYILLLLGLILAAGGLLSILGGHRDIGYISAFHFWCQIVTIVGVMVFLGRLVFEPYFFTSYFNLNLIYLLNFVSFLSALTIVLFALIDLSKSYQSKIDRIGSDRDKFYVIELGGFLPRTYLEVVEYARQAKNSTVLEEYWGLFSAITKKISAVPVDSVIHALGNMRAVFLFAIKSQPDIVVTTRNSMEPNWQMWGFGANYWFYKPLIENYAPFKITPTTIIWRKNSKKPMAVTGCNIESNGKSFNLVSSSPGYYEVVIKFEGLVEGRSLFMLKNGLNYAANSGGYLSLNPNSKTVELPVLALHSGDNYYDLKVLSNNLADANVSLVSCTARKIAVGWPEFNPDPVINAANVAFNLTDENWIGGVGKNFSAIFVLNNELNRDEFLPGRSIRFSNEEVRKIDHVASSGSYLNIFLEGSPLDGQLVGFPRNFEVLK